MSSCNSSIVVDVHIVDDVQCKARKFSRHQPVSNKTSAVGAVPRLLNFMARRICLEVMPHNATSSASGDDMSMIVSWNSGVWPIHTTMWRNVLLQDGSQRLVCPVGHLFWPSCKYVATARMVENADRTTKETNTTPVVPSTRRLSSLLIAAGADAAAVQRLGQPRGGRRTRAARRALRG